MDITAKYDANRDRVTITVDAGKTGTQTAAIAAEADQPLAVTEHVRLQLWVDDAQELHQALGEVLTATVGPLARYDAETGRVPTLGERLRAVPGELDETEETWHVGSGTLMVGDAAHLATALDLLTQTITLQAKSLDIIEADNNHLRQLLELATNAPSWTTTDDATDGVERAPGHPFGQWTRQDVEAAAAEQRHQAAIASRVWEHEQAAASQPMSAYGAPDLAMDPDPQEEVWNPTPDPEEGPVLDRHLPCGHVGCNVTVTGRLGGEYRHDGPGDYDHEPTPAF